MKMNNASAYFPLLSTTIMNGFSMCLLDLCTLESLLNLAS